MGNAKEEYPEKERIKAAGKPVEVCFKSFTYYGSHDCDSSGERLVEVINNKGESYAMRDYGNEPIGTEDWKKIFDGIYLTLKEEYSGSSKNSATCVKVEPEACPVEIIGNHFHRYSASDYPHSGADNSDEFYIIVVEK